MAPRNKGEQKEQPQKPSTTKDYEVKTGSDKRVVVRPEQVEDHEAFTDRMWKRLQR